MATFTVWRFDDEDGADRAAQVLQDAESDGLITIVDRAVVAWPAGATRPSTRHRANDELRRDAGWGTFWGLLFGGLFGLPLLGAAAGAGVGAVRRAMDQVGISKEQMDTLRWQITEGTSALFIISDGAQLDRLGERLRGTPMVLMDTNLTDVEQARLLGSLGGE